MVIVGENLKGLILSESICSVDHFDNFSINLKLDSSIYRQSEKAPTEKVIRYGLQRVDDYYDLERLEDGSLKIAPGECILACSSELIRMPLGYLGLVQTKGTLARLFISAHCSDSQIEPGFSGKITLEIVNHSSFSVEIPVGANIAQLYILRCSTDNSEPYSGKYQESDLPTLPLPIK
ncbi:MAG: hypothetical protein MK192_02405 [Idiomarina sp.]|nr:hypothetical protein [Idiomarina sp.]